MNEGELKANWRLDDFFTQDLNINPFLPHADATFGAVGFTLSETSERCAVVCSAVLCCFAAVALFLSRLCLERSPQD